MKIPALIESAGCAVETLAKLQTNIGVINRSQEDINYNVPIEEVRQKEADYFAEHPDYK